MKTMRCYTANLADRPNGNPLYRAHAREAAGRPAVCQYQEHGGKGRDSTTVESLMRRRTVPMPPLECGTEGAHRWVARERSRVGSVQVVHMSAHGPHRKSTSFAIQMAWLHALGVYTRDLTARGHEWEVGGDFNLPLALVARILGGVAYGEGIEGHVVSKGLRVVDHGTDEWALNHRASDHPARWIELDDRRRSWVRLQQAVRRG